MRKRLKRKKEENIAAWDICGSLWLGWGGWLVFIVIFFGEEEMRWWLRMLQMWSHMWSRAQSEKQTTDKVFSHFFSLCNTSNSGLIRIRWFDDTGFFFQQFEWLELVCFDMKPNRDELSRCWCRGGSRRCCHADINAISWLDSTLIGGLVEVDGVFFDDDDFFCFCQFVSLARITLDFYLWF